MDAIATWFYNGDPIGHMRYMWHTRQYIERDAKENAIEDGADYLVINFNRDSYIVDYERHKSRWFKV